MLEISETLIGEIEQQAEITYPHECGGMLIGIFDEERRIVSEIFPLENAREESARHNRVLILPQDVLRAEKHALSKKLDVVGYYHSHPDAPAVPSQYDLDHALPVWSYLIVSVLDGKTNDSRSWQMKNDRSKFLEEEIVRHQEAQKSKMSL